MYDSISSYVRATFWLPGWPKSEMENWLCFQTSRWTIFIGFTLCTRIMQTNFCWWNFQVGANRFVFADTHRERDRQWARVDRDFFFICDLSFRDIRKFDHFYGGNRIGWACVLMSAWIWPFDSTSSLLSLDVLTQNSCGNIIYIRVIPPYVIAFDCGMSPK